LLADFVGMKANTLVPALLGAKPHDIGDADW
jgi:hypothetical protein